MSTENLTQILEMLQDSKEHRIQDITNEIKLPDEIIYIMLSFLQEQAFIETSKGTFRISSKGMKLLKLPSDFFSLT